MGDVGLNRVAFGGEIEVKALRRMSPHFVFVLMRGIASHVQADCRELRTTAAS